MDTLTNRRLRWFGHAQRMEEALLPKQVLTWNPTDGKGKRGRPRKNWTDTMSKDLEDIKMTWEKAQEVATSHREDVMAKLCCRCAAGTRRTNVYYKVRGAFGNSAQSARIISSAHITVRLFARNDPLCVRK